MQEKPDIEWDWWMTVEAIGYSIGLGFYVSTWNEVSGMIAGIAALLFIRYLYCYSKEK